VDNPFVPGEKMYKSGDLARWRNDGNIEFLGRVDTQVKIRGFRIELEEIERNLLHYPNLKEAVVVAKEQEQQDKYLCAYITADEAVNKSEMRQFLQEKLPDYMVPTYLIQIERIPLTANGKVDKRALPEVSAEDLIRGHYEAPVNETEKKLVGIWKQVLGIEKVGTSDNFFDLGGNSLNLIRLLSDIKKVLDIHLDLSITYQNPTIKLMTQLIKNHQALLNENGCLLLNSQNNNHVFAFPPIGGFGIVYKDLAKLIDSHSFYAFDFIPSDYMVKRYTELIRNIQQEGPYILIGYSAGGNLAFEVAVELISQGLEVSDLVLLDSYMIDNQVAQIHSEDQIKLYHNIMEEAAQNPIYRNYIKVDYFRDNIKAKILAYTEYLNTLTNDRIINTDIHLIEAEMDMESVEKTLKLPQWGEFTTKRAAKYKGYGEHNEMIKGEYLQGNAEIMRNILKLTGIIPATAMK
jgi:thioesterase domain-containing protein/acyl carrier protein